MKKIAFIVASLITICFVGLPVMAVEGDGTATGEMAPSETSENVVTDDANVVELTETQKAAIVDHCGQIKEDLKQVQRLDSRARVYLGRYYETILTKFATPLNIRLVENNISNAKLIASQTDFAERKQKFATDYISYQQSLEELIGLDCKTEPQAFYNKLTTVRQRRDKVNQDTVKARNLITDHVKLVTELKEQL